MDYGKLKSNRITRISIGILRVDSMCMRGTRKQLNLRQRFAGFVFERFLHFDIKFNILLFIYT